MRKSTVWVMAVAAGIVVANNYYNQPLLVEFARTFNVSEKSAGIVSALTQLGYAIGMLIFLPLGDMLERRKLICTMLLLAMLALVSTALSPTMHWLMASSFAIGLMSVVPQLITPFAASLATPEKRGSVVGTVMGGLLAGILLSRTVAGIVGAHWSWHAMYWIASVLMLLLFFVLRWQLPEGKPTFKGTYAGLMRSMVELIRHQPVLRETSLVAALQFAAFSAFWTTLAFQVYALNYGSAVAGMFGIIGVAGACAAPYAGKFADRRSPQLAAMLSSIVIAVSYLVFLFAGNWIWGLVVGVLVLDLGMQSGHVSNMTRNYSLKAEAMSRINTVYMVTRFAGGTAGSVLGTYAWSGWKWTGVCCVGLLLSVSAVVLQYLLQKQYGAHAMAPLQKEASQ